MNAKATRSSAQPDARSRLLDAAMQVIREKGYASTTVDELCARAGVAKGSFFHHFKDKEALALGAAEYWSAATGALFAEAPYHRHKYIHDLKMPREDLGVLHRTGVRYVFFDPLRHLIPRDYVPFLGAPDLVNDFYCGRKAHHCPFTYKISAMYHLYRATTKNEGKIGAPAD